MARLLAALQPDAAALQEVPVGAIARIAAIAGMRALWVRTGPLIGGVEPRDRLGRARPDLWRTRESNANVLLVGPRLRLVAGSGRTAILNDRLTMVRALVGHRIGPAAVAAWVRERRGMVWATARTGDGAGITLACLHLHNGHTDVTAQAEATRAGRLLAPAAGPAILAGDLNVPPGEGPHRALVSSGWWDAGAHPGIDRILHRGLTVVSAPEALGTARRTVLAPHRGRWAPVVLSDHAPVVGRFGTPAPAPPGPAPRVRPVRAR
jgi:hypothetical protein